MIKSQNLTEYITTAIITMFIVLLLAAGFVFFMGEHIVEKKTKEASHQDVLQDYMVSLLIDKNNYLSSKFPNDYSYNLKLATLYDYQKKYKKAELEYENAVKKVAFGNFKPIYKQACFYIQRGDYNKAQEIMNSMGEMPNNKLIEYKGSFYKLLAEALIKDGYHALGVIKYEKALFYQTKIKLPKKELQDTKTKLLDAYLVLANKYVVVDDIDNAIKILVKAYDLIPSNLIKYKLAILTMDNDPKKSADLFADVIEEDPLLVDFKLYYNLLNKISNDEYNAGNETVAKLYRVKALNLEKYAIRNIIYSTDLSVNSIDVEFFNNKKHKLNNVKLKLKLKNESAFSILNMTLVVVFKDGDKVFDSCVNNNLFNKENVFPSQETTPYLIINATQPYKKQNNLSNTLTIEIYAYKNPKFKQLITVYNVKKPKDFIQIPQQNALWIFLKTLPFL